MVGFPYAFAMRKIFLLLGLVSLSVIAAPVRSNLGGDGVGYIEDAVVDYTAADYVQDGLYGLWDGLENAGFGIHDAGLRKIVDLSGNGHDISMPTSWILGDDYINSKTKAVKETFTSEDLDNIYADGLTVEMVVIILSEDKMELFCWSPYGGISFHYNSSYTPIGHIMFDISVSGDGGSSYIYPHFAMDIPSRHTITFTMKVGGPSYLYLDGKVADYNSTFGKMRRDYSGLHCFAGWGNDNKAPDNLFHCARFYTRALTAEEVKYNAVVDKVRFGL